MILAAILWHVITVGHLAQAQPNHWSSEMATHLELTGYVTYEKHEDDGDLHLRICDSADVVGMDRQHCIVAECIPALPCKRPPLGKPVRVRGISRFDDEAGHGWWELHPVLSLTSP